MSTRSKVWIGVAAFAVFIAIYYPFSPAGRQAANMRKAEQFNVSLRPKLKADPRFGSIDLDSLTAFGGCDDVTGEAASNADIDALKAFVQQNHPPVLVVFHVGVPPATATAPSIGH